MNRFIFPLIFLYFFFQGEHAVAQCPDNVIPVPSEIVLRDGTYVFEKTPEIEFVRDKKISPEGYVMKITRKGIQVKA